MMRLLAVPLALFAVALPAQGQEADAAKLKAELEKTKADQEVFVRQLEVQLTQIGDLTGKVEDFRMKLAKALNEKNLLAAELQFARQMSERLQDDISKLEEKHVELLREKKQFEDKVRTLSAVPPPKATGEPDPNAPRPAPAVLPVSPGRVEALRGIRNELDQIRKQVRELSGQLYPAWSGAGFYSEDAPEELREHLGISHGLIVRALRDNSSAAKVGLKVHDVVPRLTEAQLIEAVEKGGPIGIVRQGKPQTLGGR